MKRGKVILLAAAIAAMSAITAANAVEVLNECDITAPYSASATLKGALYESASATASVLGIVELKLGKVNEKKQTSKISGSVIGLDGKKHAIKAFVATGVDGASPKQAALEVRGLGTMSVTIGGERFAGSLGGLHVQSAETVRTATIGHPFRTRTTTTHGPSTSVRAAMARTMTTAAATTVGLFALCEDLPSSARIVRVFD